MRFDYLYRAMRSAFVFLMGALVMACGEDNPEPETKPDITVDASCLEVFSSGIRVEAEPQGGTFTKEILFTATDKWTASITGEGSTDWVSVRPSSGAAGKGSVTISVTTNDSELERRASVAITCGTVSRSFTVIQDGKIPVTSEPSVFNVTDPEESGIMIVSYDSAKRELVMKVPENKIPQVGDIICSGRTEDAPFGFLFEVGSITVSDTRSTDDMVQRYVRIGAAVSTLYGIFQKLGIEVDQWYSLGKADASFTDNSGHSLVPVKDKDGIDVFSINLPLKIHDDVKIEYTHELSVPRCSLYLNTKTINIVMGYDVLLKNYDLVHLNAKGKLPFSKKGELIKDMGWDHPSFVHCYDLQLGPVPVVITTQYLMTVPYEYTFSANLDMDIYKRVSYHHMGGYYHTMSDSFIPLEGSSDFLEILEGEDEGEYQSEYSDKEFSATLDGKFSIGVDFGYSVGLYGGNIDDDGDISTGLNYLSVGANAGIKVSDKMSLGGMMNLNEESNNSVRIIDEQTIKGSIYGKVWGTVLSTDVLGADIEVLTAEKEWDFYKKELYSSFFVPYYSKLKVTSITRQNFINVTANKHKPLFGKWESMFNETDFGLCLESFDGSDYWVSSLKGHPIDSKTGEFSFDIPIDISNLRRNVKYSVYPYSKVSNFLLSGKEKMVCREGVSFTISDDGQLSVATIDDVPGEQL